MIPRMLKGPPCLPETYARKVERQRDSLRAGLRCLQLPLATPIPEQCRVEQIAVSKEHGALPSRLHQQGQVVGRGHNRLYVRFECDDQLISLRPHVVRVLDTAPGGC